MSWSDSFSDFNDSDGYYGAYYDSDESSVSICVSGGLGSQLEMYSPTQLEKTYYRNFHLGCFDPKNVVVLGSYNYVDNKKPKIIIPGKSDT